jgi:DNA polymerase/3'-5' exonuclease PolX
VEFRSYRIIDGEVTEEEVSVVPALNTPWAPPEHRPDERDLRSS